MAIDEWLVDVRVVDRHLASGRLSREEYDRYLKRLRDCSKGAEGVESSLADRGVFAKGTDRVEKKRREDK